MSNLKFFVKEYTSVSDWLIVSRLVLDSYGQLRRGGNKYSVECSNGSLWLCEYHYDEMDDDEVLLRRVRIGHNEKDLRDYFCELGFDVLLPVDPVLFD